jgi:hypothetical protein
VPHKSDSMVRTLAMQMLDPIEPPSKVRPDAKVTPELERVVMRALAKKRDERYPNMADFVTDLERACPGIPIGVPAPQPHDGPLQLVPAPPGADPRVMSDQRTVNDGGAPAPEIRKATPNAITAPVPGAEGPRATSKRVANEPRFVTSQRPKTFDHVFEEESAAPKKKSPWPLVVILIVVAAGGGIAAALVMKDRGATPSAQEDERAIDAAPAPRATDAGVPVAVDAQVVIEVPLDAAPLPIDAGARRPPRDGGGAKKADAGVPREKLTPRGTVAVQIITKPENASVYLDDSYRGSGNVTIEEEPGKKGKIKCTLPGYDPGYANVKFDGSIEVVMCRPVRTKKCVDGLHNPFDDCPDPEPPKDP